MGSETAEPQAKGTETAHHQEQLGQPATSPQLAVAAKAYGCTEKEIAAMLKRVRPEMRGAFLAGKLRVSRASSPDTAQSSRKDGASVATSMTRTEIVDAMARMNRRARKENWPAAKAGAMRRELARRFVGGEVTVEELKQWVRNPDAVPSTADPGE